MQSPRSRRPATLLVFWLITLALSSVPSAIPAAHAAGLLYINPPQQGPFTSGTTVTYQVKVANIDPFNGWDISVQTDPTAINPNTVSITGNLLAANFSQTVFEIIDCVNGAGRGCTATDGPGIVHSAAVALSNATQSGPSSGLLFTIAYTAGTGVFSPVHILSATVSNGTSTPVSFMARDGSYGTSQADFLIDVDSRFLDIPLGSSSISTVSLTSLNGFTGTVGLTATVSPVITSGPTTSFNRPSPMLSAGGTNSSTLTVSASPTATISNYNITIHGSSGSLTHSLTIFVRVQSFSISANPTGLALVRSSNGTVTVAATSLNGFSGKVYLTTKVSPLLANGPITGVSPSLTLAGNTLALVMNVTVPKDAPVGRYTVTVTGTSGSISLNATVAVTVTDFTVTATPTTITDLHPGSSATSTIAVAPVYGFTGMVSVTATGAPAGCASTLSLTSITLGTSGASTLTVGCTSVATFTVNVTATSGTRSQSVTVSVVVTDLTITASPNSVSFLSGSSATSKITITPDNGFVGIVGLTATGAPAGCAVTVSPNSVTLGAASHSTLTISCVSAATFTVTVTGASGALSHLATVSVTVKTSIVVTSIAISPASSATIGQTVTVTATVLNNGTTTQSFTLRILWGDLTVAEQTETLDPGQSKPFTLYWDTSGRTPDNRPMTAVVSSGSSIPGTSLKLVAPAQPFLTSTEVLLAAVGGAIAAMAILSLFLFFRRRKPPGLQASGTAISGD